MMKALLHIDDYPELALLAWNRAVREIAPNEALDLYERNWRFVDHEHMIPAEVKLLKQLVAQYGNNVLHV